LLQLLVILCHSARLHRKRIFVLRIAGRRLHPPETPIEPSKILSAKFSLFYVFIVMRCGYGYGYFDRSASQPISMTGWSSRPTISLIYSWLREEAILF
jgi:hypothetical protein